MRILSLITDRCAPATNGTRVRNYFLWPEVKKLGAEVRLLGMDIQPNPNFSPAPPHIESDFVQHQQEPKLLRAMHSLLYSYHQWPYSLALENKLDAIIREWKPDIIHAEELRMAKYLPCMRGLNLGIKQSATFHNVESDLILQTGSSALPLLRPLVNQIHRRNLLLFERKTAENCDITFAYSRVDMLRYATLFRKANWSYTSGGAHVDDSLLTTPPESPSLLIVGTLSYLPNIEGIHWFLEFVLPLLPKKTKISVAGSNASPELKQRLVQAGIKFIDTPIDLRTIYQSHAICLVPLLSGSGTRGRILEALSYGRPVVTSTKGVEGLEIERGEGVLVADAPDDFAKKIILLMENFNERKLISRCGFLKAKKYFNWSVVAKDLVEQWKNLLDGKYISHRE